MKMVLLPAVVATFWNLLGAIQALNHGYDHEYEKKHHVILADTHNFRTIVGSFEYCLVYWADSRSEEHPKVFHAVNNAARILSTSVHNKFLPPVIQVDLRSPVNHQHEHELDEHHDGNLNPLDSDLAKFYKIQESRFH